MNVCFRVDAGTHIGDGHVMRCLALADELAKRGAITIFICGSGTEIAAVGISGHNHRLLAMPAISTGCAPWSESDDARQTLGVLSENKLIPDWLVVDHYQLARDWEDRVRPAVSKLLVIDDLANRPHSCDLLLDPTYAQTEMRYKGLLPPVCCGLCGSEYALLRPQFRTRRQEIERDFPPAGNMCVHVFFGSTDAENHTIRFSRLLLRGFPTLRVRAAVGRAYAHRTQLEDLATKHGGRFSWAAGVSDMAGDMADCDVALGAPGGTTWERACIGLPAAYLAVSANQPVILEQLQNAGLCIYFGMANTVGDAEFLGATRRFLADAPRLQSMRRTGMTAIDGGGASRVADILVRMQ